MSEEREIAVERMQHMIEAADTIAEYVARGREAYDADSAVRDAILFRVEWSAFARMRDRITHQYWAVDPQIVWDTAVTDIPEVRSLLAGALARIA